MSVEGCVAAEVSAADVAACCSPDLFCWQQVNKKASSSSGIIRFILLCILLSSVRFCPSQVFGSGFARLGVWGRSPQVRLPLSAAEGGAEGRRTWYLWVWFQFDVLRACLRFGFRGKKRQFFDETTSPGFMSGRRENGRLANPGNYREPDHFSNEVSSKKGRFFSGS